MKNIYVIGKLKGKYRTQNLIKALMDDEYNLFWNSVNLHNYIKGTSISKRILRSIFKAVNGFLLFPFKLYLLLLSDLVILTAMNNYNQWELFLASKVLRKKVIVDFYISIFDTYIQDRKKYTSNSIRGKLYLLFDRNIVLFADKVIFLNKAEKNYYLKTIGISKESIDYQIIPLCVEEKKFINPLYFDGYRDEFKICWWGSYIPLHGLEKIILAADVLKKKGFKFKMYLFGNSESNSLEYRELVRDNDLLECVIIENNLTFSNGKLTEFLESNCDLVLGNFGDSQKAKSVLVNKLVDGIAMKAPILTGESAATNEFFDFTNDIWKCKNNPNDIADMIVEISKSSIQEINKRVNNAYIIYVENFSEKIFKERIRDLISEVYR